MGRNSQLVTTSNPDEIIALAKAEAAAADLLAEATRKRREAEVAAEMHVALAIAANDRAHAKMPLTKRARADFITLLSAGVPVQEICSRLQLASRTLYDARHADPEFNRLWEDAIERRYLPIEDRLASIARSGDPSSMATVRAAEVLLKGSIRRYSQSPATNASAKLTQHADGSKTFETRLGAFSD